MNFYDIFFLKKVEISIYENENCTHYPFISPLRLGSSVQYFFFLNITLHKVIFNFILCAAVSNTKYGPLND